MSYNVKPENSFLSSEQSESNKSKEEFFNDKYAEWDTVETINSIRDALAKHHDVTMIEADEDAFEKFKKVKPDIVFNFSECANGISREAQIPAMLDMLQIPYTGSDPLTLTTCLHKGRTKEVLAYHKIPTPKFFIANVKNIKIQNDLKFPLLIKPLHEGSSKGIFNSSYISNDEELQNALKHKVEKYNQPFIVEEFLQGREFTVAIMGNDDEVKVLPIIEMRVDELPDDLVPMYSFEAKWIFDTRDNPLDIFTCPANISEELEEKIKSIALKTYEVLNCKDWSRVDIRLDEKGEPSVLEVNPLPGILPDPKDNSSFPKAALAVGIGYEELINEVLYLAAKRHKLV